MRQRNYPSGPTCCCCVSNCFDGRRNLSSIVFGVLDFASSKRFFFFVFFTLTFFRSQLFLKFKKVRSREFPKKREWRRARTCLQMKSNQKRKHLVCSAKLGVPKTEVGTIFRHVLIFASNKF